MHCRHTTSAIEYMKSRLFDPDLTVRITLVYFPVAFTIPNKMPAARENQYRSLAKSAMLSYQGA